MVGRLAPSQIIIVHGWQIVVNQGHGMDHFQGNRSRQSHFLCGLFGGSKHFGCGQTQDRSDALATGHEGIAHGLADQVRVGRVDRFDGFFEHFVNGRLFAHDVFTQIKGCRGFGGAGGKSRGKGGVLLCGAKGSGGRRGQGHKGSETGDGDSHFAVMDSYDFD